MTSVQHAKLIAVVGGSGAGKSWLVDRLCRLLRDAACHLQLDDFYRDLSHLPIERRAQTNFDVPAAIDWERAHDVLLSCREGKGAALPRYDFATYCRHGECAPWDPRPMVFVDGLWLLHEPNVRELFALKIFLDAPAELRCQRRRARDLAERGYTLETIERQLHADVLPMHDRYVEPQKQWADVVLTHPFSEDQLIALADRLWELVGAAGVSLPVGQDAFRSELLSLVGNHEYCT